MPARAKPVLVAEWKELLRFESLLLDISAQFVNLPASQVDQEIYNAQRLICRSLGMDQSTVWQVSPEDSNLLLLTHIFQGPGLPVPPTFMNAQEFFPWCLKQVLANKVVSVPETSKAPPEAAIDMATWRYYQVKSVLAIPIVIGGRTPFGALSFESIQKERTWSEPQKNRLRLIAQVFANALERKHYEERLLESEARLSLAANASGAVLWTLDVDRRVLWASSNSSSLFGIEPGQAIDFETYFSLVHPEDAEAVETTIRKAMLSGEEERIEYRIVRHDGAVRWVISRGRRHPGGMPGTYVLMGLTADITERKQAEHERNEFSQRLLEAQEAERSRIARELHDDVGQSHALLCVGIQRAAKAAGAPNRELEALSKDAEKIAKRISEISRELHSSTLDYLGLKVAVEKICRETAERRGIPVVFSCDPIPVGLNKNISLGFFRVIQEALQNITKHSGAAHVDVKVTVTGGYLSVSIVDDGRGFEFEKIRRSSGLGLISMRERMNLLGGQFEISSKAGEGTIIRARAAIRTVEK